MHFKPHSEKQDLAVFSTKPIVVCATGIQWGKALALDTKVLTPSGYIPLDQIAVGDLVIDRNGDPTKVLGVYDQGMRPCYRVNLRYGLSFVADEEHLHCIIPRSGRSEKILTTKQLYEKVFLWNKARIPSLSGPVKIPNKEFHISPYNLGVLLGDGGLSVGSVSFDNHDQDVVERFRRELPENLQLNSSAKGSYRIVHTGYKTNSKGHPINEYKQTLVNLGLFGLKSNEKFIPDEYKYAGWEQRLELLRGLMDTDGYVEQNKKMEYCTTSKRLAEDVIWLVESLSGKAWIRYKPEPKYIYNGEIRIGKPAYNVNIILKAFNPFHLPRRKSKYFIHENTEDKIIESVEKIEDRLTRCISVESPTKTFVIENQVITHNTISGAVKMNMAMHEYTEPGDNFIVTAPTYKIMQQATIPAFKKAVDDPDWKNNFSKVDMVYRKPGGGTCYFRTSTDPDSVIGITDVRFIHCDEAGLYPLYFWENIQARAAFRKAQIIITTSPYSLNWLYKEIIRPIMKHGPEVREDVDLVRARSNENPYFPDEYYEAKKRTMDARRFQMIFGGEWDKFAGLVYDCFEEDVHTCESFRLPAGTRFFAGVDWGYTNPFAISVRAITPDGSHYQVAECYETGLTIGAMIERAGMLKKVWNIERFYCDPSSPAYIEDFCRNGLTAVAADNDIRRGIDAHYELIKNNRFKIFMPGNKYTIEELSTYHYPDDEDNRGPNMDYRERLPVARENHLMDSARYVSIATHRFEGLTPVVVSETADKIKKKESYEERYARLTRINNNNMTESWD